MRKGLFTICAGVAVLIVLLAVFVPSCGGTKGTIEVKATVDGSPWTGAVNYTLTGATSNVTGTTVAKTFSVDAGNWTCAYVSGGPAAAYFVNITPSPTQSVSAGGSITFTLNFATFAASPLDASATFKSWTINGVEVPPGVYVVGPNTIIDAEYIEHVSGATGAPVTVHQTSWLQVHNIGIEGGPGPTITLHVLNGLGAVSMNPPATVSNQKCTVEGLPVSPCDMISLYYCEPVNLDVEVDLKLVVCNNYTKTINWLGIPSPTNILFDVTGPLLAGQSLNMTSYACVDLEGDTDPSNDCTVASPTLTIIYALTPP
jgi:hypothetical protein